MTSAMSMERVTLDPAICHGETVCAGVAADAHDLDVTYVITVYRPNPDLWTEDFRTKRRDEQDSN